jgi:energy-coupling factor transporter transmembrane protein EcfT
MEKTERQKREMLTEKDRWYVVQEKPIRRSKPLIFAVGLSLFISSLFLAQALLIGTLGGLLIGFFAENNENEKKIKAFCLPLVLLGPLVYIIFNYFSLLGGDFNWANTAIILGLNWAGAIVTGIVIVPDKK